jgi:hypothetical protein
MKIQKGYFAATALRHLHRLREIFGHRIIELDFGAMTMSTSSEAVKVFVIDTISNSVSRSNASPARPPEPPMYVRGR